MTLRDQLTDLLLASRCTVPGCDCELTRLAMILDMSPGWPPHAVAVLDELIDREAVAVLLGQLMDTHAAMAMVRRGEVEAEA